MSQPRQKSLRNRTSTQTKHSEAFNDPQLQASYNPDQDLRFIAPISTGFMSSYPFHFMPFNTMPFNATMAEQIIQQNHNVHQDVFTSLPLKQIAGGGMRIVCEIDMQLLRNYYPLRELVFNKSNNIQGKRMDNNVQPINWLKARIDYHFKPKVASTLRNLIDEVQQTIQFVKQEFPQSTYEKRLQQSPNEFHQLDKEMQGHKKPEGYLSPNDLQKLIAKLIEYYLQSQ